MSGKKNHGGYPRQTAPAYPVQQAPVYPMQQAAPGPYMGTPGAYGQPYPAGYGAAPAPYGTQPPPYAPPGYQPMMQPQPMYVGVGQFDPGARFDGAAQPNIPPPPPGCAPNAAQFAQQQGGKAVVNNARPTNFLWGDDGGVSWGF